MSAVRSSPLHSAHVALNPLWITINHMPVPLQFAPHEEDVRQKLGLADVSFLSRFGVKGPAAGEWLRSQGVAPPSEINHWDDIEQGGLVARLARSEFLVEDGLEGVTAARLAAELGRGLPGVTPVFRQDASIVITGKEINSLLVQTCNVNFNSFPLEERRLVMTSMTGISVLVIRKLSDGVPLYRIWCDGTFGACLWKTLLQVSQELGGAAIGINSLYPDLAKLKALSLR
jgi:sarcosine oxidase subunit gamma